MIKFIRFFDKIVEIHTNNFFSYMYLLIYDKPFYDEHLDKLLTTMFFEIHRSDTGLIKFDLIKFDTAEAEAEIPLYKYVYIYKKLDKYLKDKLKTDNIVFSVLDSNDNHLLPTINSLKKTGIKFTIDINFKETLYDHDAYYIYLQNDTCKNLFLKCIIKPLFSRIKEFMSFYL